MGHKSERDRDLGACDGCEKVYPVHISEDTITPIGIGECRSCGGTKFSLLEDDSTQPPVADGSGRSSTAED